MTDRWIYSHLDEAITTVGTEEVETNILHLWNTVSQYISTWLILELCLTTDKRTGAQVMMIWLEQAGLDLGQ